MEFDFDFDINEYYDFVTYWNMIDNYITQGGL
jgi:hypothetical protein